MLYDTAKGGVEEGQRLSVEELTSVWAFVEWLCRLQVDVVLCCGVHPQARTTLSARGLDIRWDLTGEAQEVLAAFLDGRLAAANTERGPGQGRRRRCRRRGRGDTDA